LKKYKEIDDENKFHYKYKFPKELEDVALALFVDNNTANYDTQKFIHRE